jgi:hypothetical protein
MPVPGGTPESTPASTPASPDAPPAELERRLSELESGRECGDDFDAVSLWGLLILGLLIPAGLLLIGWLA